MKKNTKTIEAHKIEKAINILMLFLGIFGIAVFFLAMKNPYFNQQAVIVEMFIVILIAILAQTAILTKLLERVM